MTRRNAGDRGTEFADLAHTILVEERSVPLRLVAARMTLGYDALYARLCSRVAFTADEIRRLIAAVPDPRLAAYLLRDTAFVAVERTPPPGAAPEEETIYRASHRVVIEAADVLAAIDRALSDRTLDAAEIAVIQAEIEVAERALVFLREHLKRRAGGA